MDKSLLDSPFFNTPMKKDEPNVPSDIEFPPLVRVDGDKVFFVENGKAHWVINPEALKALGGTFDMVKTVSKEDFFTLNKNTETITPDNAKIYAGLIPVVEKKVEEKTDEVPVKEFKTYDKSIGYSDASVENAPKSEPEKGFTSIIIPARFLNYHIFHQTGHCIGSIQEHTDSIKTPYEIILVIDGKTGIGFSNPNETQCNKIIEMEESKGYAAAVNKGIRVARGEYIVIMNNDVLVFNHWLEDFHEALNHKDLVMATPMYGMPYARAKKAAELRESAPIDPFSDFNDFSCVATRKSLFNEIGMFDEGFYLYKEDIDLFKRMEKTGKTFASTKRIPTFHMIGMTTITMSPDKKKQEQSDRHWQEKYGAA